MRKSWGSIQPPVVSLSQALLWLPSSGPTGIGPLCTLLGEPAFLFILSSFFFNYIDHLICMRFMSFWLYKININRIQLCRAKWWLYLDIQCLYLCSCGNTRAHQLNGKARGPGCDPSLVYTDPCRSFPFLQAQCDSQVCACENLLSNHRSLYCQL